MFRKMVIVVAVAFLLGGCSKGGVPPATTTVVPDIAAQEEANKAVALEFFREGITADERYELMHPDYIQHNPVFKKFGEINQTTGREEFKLLLEMRERFPVPPAAPDPNRPPNETRYLVMADGDLVTVMQRRYQPDPLKAGEYYESFWFDTWRIKEGKLYEHWDAATIDPDNIPAFLRTRVDEMR